MSNDVAKGEIVFCDLNFSHKDRKYKLTRVVYKIEPDGMFYHQRMPKELKVKDRVKVDSVDVISRLGFENKNINN